MKYININRTNKECYEKVIEYINKNNTYKCEKIRKKHIQETKKEPIKTIRYIDNNIRIYEARKNWFNIFRLVKKN